MSDLTNKQLQAQVRALAKKTARTGEEIGRLAVFFTEEAQDTRRVADGIGAKKVDPDTVSETSELAKIIDGLSEGAIAYAATAKDTSRHADCLAKTTSTVHDGIGEQVNRSPARNIHGVDRTWFEQQ
jgi:hypothetical protein